MKSPLASMVLLLMTAMSATAQPQPPGPAVIVTSGQGVVKRTPDRAWVTIGAESRAKTAQEAQRANTDAMTAVIDRVKAAGIAADAIQTSGYDLQPEFDYVNGKQSLRGYVARNQLQVRVDALAKTGEIMTAVVANGATTVSGVRFDLKDREGAERQALGLAVRDARQRADALAGGAGVTIDRIIRIEEQRDLDTPRPMAYSGVAMMKAEGAPVPVEAGEIEVRARVAMTAALR